MEAHRRDMSAELEAARRSAHASTRQLDRCRAELDALRSQLKAAPGEKAVDAEPLLVASVPSALLRDVRDRLVAKLVAEAHRKAIAAAPAGTGAGAAAVAAEPAVAAERDEAMIKRMEELEARAEDAERLAESRAVALDALRAEMEALRAKLASTTMEVRPSLVAPAAS